MSAREKQREGFGSPGWPADPDMIGYAVTTPAGKSFRSVAATDLDWVFVKHGASGRLGRRKSQSGAVSWSHVAWVDAADKTLVVTDQGAAALSSGRTPRSPRGSPPHEPERSSRDE
jgi:hypothetical protein